MDVVCNQMLEEEAPPEVTWRQDITDELVKSAGRTLQILEYFSDVRRSATIAEIAQALHYPHSSTAALLHTMMELGYMVFDRQTRRYRPSSSVALLGSWIDERVAHDGPLQELMRVVAGQTQEMVLLACRNGLYCKFLYAIQPKSLNRLCSNGTILPLVNVAAGSVLLSGLPEAEIRRIVLRSNAQGISSPPVNHACFVEEVVRFRAQKYLIAPTVLERFDQLVVGLPSKNGDPDLALILGGEHETLRNSAPALLELLEKACIDILNYRPGFGDSTRRASAVPNSRSATRPYLAAQRPMN
jgi:DNA-binding IclR family transcriptional regulator